MARFEHPLQDRPPVAPHRRRATWIVTLAVGIGSILALVALSEIADASPLDPPSSDGALVCTSEVVTIGDIRTSASWATRVPSDLPTPPPDGCTVQTVP